jgi:hypothetical protein
MGGDPNQQRGPLQNLGQSAVPNQLGGPLADGGGLLGNLRNRMGPFAMNTPTPPDPEQQIGALNPTVDPTATQPTFIPENRGDVESGQNPNNMQPQGPALFSPYNQWLLANSGNNPLMNFGTLLNPPGGPERNAFFNRTR